MISVLLVVRYLTQMMKKHLSLIRNHWTWFVPHLLVKNKQQDLKKVYYAVRYILNEAKLKKGWFLYLPQNSVCLKKFIKMSDTFILEGNWIKDNSNMSTKNTVWIICVDIWMVEGNYLNLLTNSYSKHKF